ncbi:transcription factor IIA alpha-beta subunit [Trypanosoma grayi]|uniref:transcription factor IIA alpha-beta subunit n=1 Tax=Trypanosoma grayi TaxID=71804 RepID=UPI0004F496A5|nr:transcription factor IIA alpha-beta subunit [Trypanosoma grayi]KEG12656.1 transcription factor IIA alpha-beta subunit [Trypanosoma grayi]
MASRVPRRKVAKCISATDDVYNRAILIFREALLERVAHHEDEVFAARARFKMQREQDREHFARVQRRRLRLQSHGSDRRAGAAAAGVAEQELLVAEEEFLADQEKLSIEHEEELQQAYPLAFLDDDSAGAVAFTLLPTLRSKLESLAQERTLCYKKYPKADEGTSNASGGALRKPQLVAVKEEQGRDVYAVCEVGRGAYIVPPMTRGPNTTADDDDRGDGNNVVVEEEEEEQQRQQQQQEEGCEYSRAAPPWMTRVSTHGAAEFVRMALLCDEAARRSRLDERRRFLECCVDPSRPRAEQRSLRRLLRRLGSDEKHEKKRAEWLWHAWRDVKSSLDGNSGWDGGSGMTRSSNSPIDAPGNDGSEGATAPLSNGNEEVDYGDDEGDDGVNVRSSLLDERFSPSRALREQRRRRMECIDSTGYCSTPNCTRGTLPAAAHTSPHGRNVSWCSFDTTRWVTIPLGDGDSSNGNSSRLEALAQTYMWPRHIEESIPHVLCGEAVRSGRRWLLFQHDTLITGAQQQEGEAEGEGGGHTSTDEALREERTVDSNSLPVVALPRQARKVWLKVNTLGDFVAGDVRFYQGHSSVSASPNAQNVSVKS